MELTGFWPLFFGGMLGPLLLELVKLTAWRDPAKIKEHYEETKYWIGTAALFVLAGLVVAIFSDGDHTSLRQAAQSGMNAPAIVWGYASVQAKRKAPFIGAIAGQKEPPKGFFQRMVELMAW